MSNSDAAGKCIGVDNFDQTNFDGRYDALGNCATKADMKTSYGKILAFVADKKTKFNAIKTEFNSIKTKSNTW